MVNFCLKDEEVKLLRSLVGKKLLKYKHDPLDKFECETVYGRIELFFSGVIVLVDYDYEPYPLFGNSDDDHPKFHIRTITEDQAISALQNIEQININYNDIIDSITLVEDFTNVEWDGKKDDVRILQAIIFKSGDRELALQGDYMIPLIDIFKGKNLRERLAKPGHDEFNRPDTKFKTDRYFLEIQ